MLLLISLNKKGKLRLTSKNDSWDGSVRHTPARAPPVHKGMGHGAPLSMDGADATVPM